MTGPPPVNKNVSHARHSPRYTARVRSIRIGSLLGIPLLINPGWFIIAGLTLWLLAFQFFPAVLPDSGRTLHIVMAVLSAVIFFASIVAHELAHSVVAKYYGIPVRSISLFIFGGVAHITREAARPFNEILMAAAGPLMSLVLGVLFLVAWVIADSSGPFGVVLAFSGFMNIILGIFNLLPAFPMDGGRVFRALVWLAVGDYNRATSVAAWVGRGFAWFIIFLGGLAALGINVGIASNVLGGIWLVLIGLFLETGARRSLTQLTYIEELNRFSLTDLMITDPPVAEADRSLESLARGVLEINPRVCYFVEDEGTLAGILSAYELREIPESLWQQMTAREAMVPREQLRPVSPSTSVSDALLEMENEGLLHAPVVDEGRVVGVIGRERIVNVLRQAGLVTG